MQESLYILFIAAVAYALTYYVVPVPVKNFGYGVSAVLVLYGLYLILTSVVLVR